MRKYLKKIVVLFFLLAALSSFAVLLHSAQPPEGYTGADGLYCTNCHSTNALNNAGGSISSSGLPATEFTAGTAYDFSITTSHSASDRKRFGFSITARNSAGLPAGTFSTTNTNAALNGDELSHFNAVSFATATIQTYTYTNLTWTAPANPTPDDQTITFYYAGNAANGSGSSGDFIYAGTKTINLSLTQTFTFTGNGNWSDAANWTNNAIPPTTISGNNITIVIDPPFNGECVLDRQQTISSNANLVVKDGKRFRVLSNLVIQ